jgi:PAS domain S-box-containing protein
MNPLNRYWKIISNLGSKDSVPYLEKRTLILVNRINLIILIISFSGFVSVLIDLLIYSRNHFSIGAYRLALMGFSSLLIIYINSGKRHKLAKILTSIIPGFFLIVFPTLLGDAKIEYFFYYPFSATALAIIPILLFHVREDRILRLALIFYCFLLTIFSDNLLVHFSRNIDFHGLFGDRYFFYKVSQLFLFLFVVPAVYIIRELNTKYENLLKEKNEILESQKEEVTNQAEELAASNEELVATNEELFSLNEELNESNEELFKYRNHLEQLVESRTSDFRESETRFRSLFENANDAIFIMKDAVFIECNIKTLEIFGCKKEQIIGQSPALFSPLFQPDGQDSETKSLEMIRLAIQSKDQHFEWKHCRYDKTTFDADISLNALELNGELFIQAIVRDITERKNAENALIESERKIRAIYDLSQQFIGLLSLEGNLLEANRTALEFIGSKLEDIVGKPFWDTPWWNLSEKNKEQIQSAIKSAQQGNQVQFETVHRSKDGTDHNFIFNLKPIFDEDGKVILLFPEGYDITGRKKAEEALKMNEERLKRLVDSTTDYIYTVETDNGVVLNTDHGEACLSVTGYSRTEFRTNNLLWFEIVHDEDKQLVLEHANNLITDKKPNWIEHRIRHKDGTIRWVRNTPVIQYNKKGERIGYDGLIQDITIRKLAELALQDSEARYRFISENTSDVTWIFNFQKNCFTYVSPTVVKLRGYTSEEVLKQKLEDTLTPESLLATSRLIRDGIAGRKPGDTSVYRTISLMDQPCKDGSIVSTEVASTSIFDSTGKLVEVIGVSRDITERKEAEEALSKEKQLRDAIIDVLPGGLFILNRNLKFVGTPKLNFLSSEHGSDINPKLKNEILANSDPFRYFHEPDKGPALKKLSEVLTTGFAEAEFRMEHIPGEILWYYFSARRLSLSDEDYIVGISIDITNRKLAEEAIKSSEEKFSKSFKDSPVPIVITSMNTGKFMDVNESFTLLSGYSKEETLGLSAKELNLWKNKEDSDKINRFIKDSRSSFKGELSFYSKSKQAFVCNTAFVKSKVGDEDCLICIFEDITERKQLQQKLFETILETEEKERRKFAADLHDEIGPQLASINIYASSLKKRIDNPEQLEILGELAEIAKKTITAVREISNNMSPHLLENYGLTAAVKAEVAGKRAFLNVEFFQNLEDIRIEAKIEIVIYRVIKELLNNTLKYAEASKVTIEIQFQNDSIIMSYTDNGKGFDFKKLISREHSGLGLLNIQSRIESIGGEFKIESQPGMGFRFEAKISTNLSNIK